ncbi:hypothetical protein GGR51DRAFT_559693 [Nemania sp. FL0031]|nr:hypothetical protein GGR51DRAFT_559693 [Nemania sp. FL0031]
MAAPRSLDIPEDLFGLFEVLGIKPETNGEAESLIDLIDNLETVGYFEHFFSSFFAGYDWQSHEWDPVHVIEKKPNFAESWGRDLWYNLESFTDCLAGWRYAIATEIQELLPAHGDSFMWYPERGNPEDAFVYSSFLLICMRAGQAPDLLPQLYADSLDYLSQVE